MPNKKLQKLLNKLQGTDDTMLGGFRAFDDGVKQLKQNLEEAIKVSTLADVNQKLKKLKETLNLTPLLDTFEQYTKNYKQLDARLTNLDDLTSDELNKIEEVIIGIQNKIRVIDNKPLQEIPDFTPQITDLESRLITLIKATEANIDSKDKSDELRELISDLEKALTKTRLELMNQMGGGSMSRQIRVEGVDALTRYTDIDFVGTTSSITTLVDNTNKRVKIVFPSGAGGGVWGSITGTLSTQTDLQTALDLKAPLASPTFTGTVAGITKTMVGLGSVDNTSDASKPVSTATQTALDAKVTANTSITGATKTKITYDTKGLVTAGADATTADIAASVNKNYVTDAQQTVITNTSGTNTGDQTLPTRASLGLATTDSPEFLAINLGHATDTTLSRNAAGVVAVEGVVVPLVNPRVISAASYTTDTGTSLNMDNLEHFVVTAQAGALLFNAPGGTLAQGRSLVIRIKDNGTARALTWNAVFRAMGNALPTTTVVSKTLYLGFFYNSTDIKWDLVASAQEA